MKRKIFASILAVTLALEVTACGIGSSRNTSNSDSKNNSQSMVEITENPDQEIEQSESEADKEGNQSRQTYTQADIDNGALDGGKITFNSITDGSIGNEIDFASVQEAAPDGQAINPHGTWEGGNITVEDGKEYVIRLYVHNNNPAGTAGMSTGTKVAISGIGQSKTNKNGKQEVEVNGFITSDNATPHEYWDYVRFNSSTSFHLDYVYGSAMIYNRGAAGTTDPISSKDIATMSAAEMNTHTVTGKPLSDDIVEKAGSADGTLIGFDALDGNVPGCYAYSSYITIRVKAVFDE